MVNDSLSESYICITFPYISYMCPRWLTADKYQLSMVVDFAAQIEVSAILIQRIPHISGDFGPISPSFGGFNALFALCPLSTGAVAAGSEENSGRRRPSERRSANVMRSEALLPSVSASDRRWRAFE